jgi:L-fucose isomerase-like protein
MWSVPSPGRGKWLSIALRPSNNPKPVPFSSRKLNRKKLIRRRKKMRQIEIERISERTGEGDRQTDSQPIFSLVGVRKKERMRRQKEEDVEKREKRHIVQRSNQGTGATD